MTLAKFKFRLRVAALMLVLVVYGGGLFLLGKYSSYKSPQVQGATTSVEPSKDKIERPQPEIDVQSGTVISSQVKLCSNTQIGFQLSYPKDWFSTYNLEKDKCLFFAPFSFVVPQNPDYDFTPVKIEPIKTTDWEQTVSFFENPNDFQNVVSVQNMEVDGRSVKKIEALSAGRDENQPLAMLTFLIPDSKSPLVVRYKQQDPKEDSEKLKKQLTDIVASIKYF